MLGEELVKRVCIPIFEEIGILRGRFEDFQIDLFMRMSNSRGRIQLPLVLKFVVDLLRRRAKTEQTGEANSVIGKTTE